MGGGATPRSRTATSGHTAVLLFGAITAVTRRCLAGLSGLQDLPKGGKNHVENRGFWAIGRGYPVGFVKPWLRVQLPFIDPTESCANLPAWDSEFPRRTRSTTRSILADARRRGVQCFEKSNGGREGTLWYYRVLVKAFRQSWDDEIVEELDRVVGELESVVAKNLEPKVAENVR